MASRRPCEESGLATIWRAPSDAARRWRSSSPRPLIRYFSIACRTRVESCFASTSTPVRSRASRASRAWVAAGAVGSPRRPPSASRTGADQSTWSASARLGETSPRVDAHSYESRRGRHVALTGNPVCLPTSFVAQSGYGLSCGSFTWNERSTSSRVPAEQDGIQRRPRRRRGIDGWDGGPDRLRILWRSRRDAGPKIA